MQVLRFNIKLTKEIKRTDFVMMEINGYNIIPTSVILKLAELGNGCRSGIGNLVQLFLVCATSKGFFYEKLVLIVTFATLDGTFDL
jgi:hypothetical protein